MLLLAAWIGLSPLAHRTARHYFAALAALTVAGVAMLALVTQFVLSLDEWYDARFVIPLGSMIFSHAMNTVSLAAERFVAESERDAATPIARRVALEAALIPQINSLFAVGLVALPGMMTGQLLSGVDPLIAARYQIMVMCMIFGSSGLAAVAYLCVITRRPTAGTLG
jgi:putative ABC transport system permease protein